MKGEVGGGRRGKHGNKYYRRIGLSFGVCCSVVNKNYHRLFACRFFVPFSSLETACISLVNAYQPVAHLVTHRKLLNKGWTLVLSALVYIS